MIKMLNIKRFITSISLLAVVALLQAQTYSVTLPTYSVGRVTANKSVAEAGDSVIFTVIPDANYYMDGRLTLELTVDAEEAQARPVLHARAAAGFVTMVDIEMSYDPSAKSYTGAYVMRHSDVRVASVNFVPKTSQDITAEDITATYGDEDVAVKGVNETPGGGSLSYSVSSGYSVVSVDAQTGELKLLRTRGRAVVTVTAAETEKYLLTKKSVTVQVLSKIEFDQNVDYYILNVEKDCFLSGQNSWGTQGTVSDEAGVFHFVPGTSGEGYNIVSTLVSVNNKNLGTDLFIDNDGLMSVKDDETAGTVKKVDGIWQIENIGGGSYTFFCPSEWTYTNGQWVETPHGYMSVSETAGSRKGYGLKFIDTPASSALFRVMTREEAVEYMAYKTKSQNVSFSFLLRNPDFCRNQSTADWTVSADCTNKNLSGGANDNMCAESWHSTFTISQTVTDLPAGNYKLQAQGFYRKDGEAADVPYLFVRGAGVDKKKNLPLLDGPENSMTDASNSFRDGKYEVSPVRFELDGKTNTIEVGFICENTTSWVIWDNVRLVSDGELPSLTVSLPDDTDLSVYQKMWLEISAGEQTRHYVVTDRAQYTFGSVERNTTWNIVLRNEKGDVFGRIDNVAVEDDDVSVAFASLTRPQNVTLSVVTPDGVDVTDQAQVTWTDASGRYLAQGTTLTGLPVGYKTTYRVALSQKPAMVFEMPQPAEYTLIDGDNSVICQLDSIPLSRLTGRIEDSLTRLPVAGALVTATQTFAGKYTKTLSAKTDAKGAYALVVANVPTSLVYAASDYVSQTAEVDFSDIDEPDTTALKPVSGAVISLAFTYTASCREGEEAEVQNWYSDYQNVSYTLYDVTDEREITDFKVNFPQIVVMEGVDNDVLRLTAVSKTNAFEPLTVDVTMDGQIGSAVFNIVEFGKIQSSYASTENASVVALLYDANGKLAKKSAYSNASVAFGALASGDYTLVTMGNSKMFSGIYDLAQLEQTGLKEAGLYIESKVTVSNGVINDINIGAVPLLNEEELSYTGENTSFAANASSVTVGNYLTLVGKVDFNSIYASKVSDVKVIVDLPEACQFVENSVMVGNSTSKDYQLDESGTQLTIPLTNYLDRVLFCVTPTRGGNYTPSAVVQFTYMGSTMRQPIGSANYRADDLTLSVPTRVSRSTIPVCGTAQSGSSVDIYDNGVLIGQTTSMANGTWSATCVLNDPYNLSRHTIQARVKTKSGLELVSEDMTCVYDRDVIEVSQVMMYHSNAQLGRTYALSFNFRDPSDKEESYIYDMYNKKFTFTVDFTNNDTTKVSDVVLWVKTAKSGWHPLQAAYDVKQRCWVAVGEFGNMFDADLPVNVSVDFASKAVSAIDGKQITDGGAAVKSSTQSFWEIRGIIDEFYRNHPEATSEDYRELCVQLGLPVEDEELAVADPSSFDEMTDEEKGAWLSDKEEDFEEDFIELSAQQKRFEAMYAFSDRYSLETADGWYFDVENAGSETREALIAEGYTELPLSGGGFAYSLISPEKSVFIYPSANMLVRVKTPAVTSARAASAQETFDNFFTTVDQARTNVLGVTAALQDRIQAPVFAQESYIQLLIQTVYELKLCVSQCEEGSEAQQLWQNWLRETEHILVAAKASLRLSKTVLASLGKAIPSLDYLNTLSDCYTTGRILQNTYRTIPENVPEKQERAEECRQDIIALVSKMDAFVKNCVVPEVTGDAAILGGAAEAVEANGVSLGVSGWAIVQKVIAEMGKYTLTQASYQADVVALQNRVSELQSSASALVSGEGSDGGAYKSNTRDKRYLIDPSGYVYEGVLSNRLEGVTATVYYKDGNDNIIKWDAEQYAQENPLFTDENGYYRWDVPAGLWQVKFEKEGYETTYSEWLPVPPPQLDINIAMQQSVAPQVKDVRAFGNAVEVDFDKYMLPSSLTVENIYVVENNRPVSGAVELLNEEAVSEGSDVKYASKIRFNAAQEFTEGEITLVVTSKVKSYAGTLMQGNYQQTFSIEQEIESIESAPAVTVTYGETKEITVTVHKPGAVIGKSLTVKNSSPMVLSVADAQPAFDEEGKAVVVVTGEMPGAASLTFTVEGSDRSATTVVTVERRADLPKVATPTSDVPSGIVSKNTAVSLECETEGAVIYYTLDGTSPAEDSPSRIEYDGTPIVITETTTITAIAVGDEMQDSEIAVFTYTVDDPEAIGQIPAALQSDIKSLPGRLIVSAGGSLIRGVTLTSVSGVQFQSLSVRGETVTVDVSAVPNGMYIVYVNTADGTFSRKVMIKR